MIDEIKKPIGIEPESPRKILAGGLFQNKKPKKDIERNSSKLLEILNENISNCLTHNKLLISL